MSAAHAPPPISRNSGAIEYLGAASTATGNEAARLMRRSLLAW
ncbi:MAG: hypothetical protein WAM65_02005 [Candidatus Korobacteraceae bacterium]